MPSLALLSKPISFATSLVAILLVAGCAQSAPIAMDTPDQTACPTEVPESEGATYRVGGNVQDAGLAVAEARLLIEVDDWAIDVCSGADGKWSAYVPDGDSVTVTIDPASLPSGTAAGAEDLTKSFGPGVAGRTTVNFFLGEEPREASAAEAVPGPTATYVVTQASEDGYSQTGTLQLGPVIPFSDTAAIDAAWAAAGGEGPVPCVDANPDGDGLTNPMRSEVAGFAFGTLSFTNNVPDFPAQDLIWKFERGSQGAVTQSAVGIGYSDGPTCTDLVVAGARVRPTWRSANWGPVPIVVTVADFLSPNTPDGDQAVLDSAPLLFGYLGGAFLADDAAVVPLVAYSPGG